MAKSKRTPKKHNFAPDHLGQALSVTSVGPGALSDTKSHAVVGNTAYIKGDVRRVLILATVFVAAELILWAIFTHTGLGSVAYSHIKL